MKKKKIIICVSILLLIIVGIVLFLIFGKKNEYTITFDSNGGTVIESQTVKENDLVKKPVDPKKTGYKFSGWFYENTLFDFNTKINKDIVLKALWSSDKIEIKAKELKLEVGNEKVLEFVSLPEGVNITDLTFTSSDQSIATVDKNGKVKAVKAGTVVVTIMTKDGQKIEITVTITEKKEEEKPEENSSSNNNNNSSNNSNNSSGNSGSSGNTSSGETPSTPTEVNPDGVSISGASTVEVGSIVTLTATVTPDNATDKSVTWSSDNPGIASVDGSGNVTGVSAGTVIVTATTSNGKTASITITVTEKPSVYVLYFTADTLEFIGGQLTYRVSVTKDGSDFTDYVSYTYNNKKHLKGESLLAPTLDGLPDVAQITLSTGETITVSVVKQ